MRIHTGYNTQKGPRPGLVNSHDQDHVEGPCTNLAPAGLCVTCQAEARPTSGTRRSKQKPRAQTQTEATSGQPWGCTTNGPQQRRITHSQGNKLGSSQTQSPSAPGLGASGPWRQRQSKESWEEARHSTTEAAPSQDPLLSTPRALSSRAPPPAFSHRPAP